MAIYLQTINDIQLTSRPIPHAEGIDTFAMGTIPILATQKCNI